MFLMCRPPSFPSSHTTASHPVRSTAVPMDSTGSAASRRSRHAGCGPAAYCSSKSQTAHCPWSWTAFTCPSPPSACSAPDCDELPDRRTAGRPADGLAGVVGASAVSAVAFQFASTNLAWELGLVLWVLIGWQFTLAEYVGGMVMIVLMVVGLRLLVSPRLEEAARAHARDADTGHIHHAAGGRAWTDVALNFRGDWQMVWKEITAGFLLAGLVAQLGDDAFTGLFVRDAFTGWSVRGGPAAITTLENGVVGPLIAVLSFVCSVGNVPLAAVLWSG